jgi:hypothetical protein
MANRKNKPTPRHIRQIPSIPQMVCFVGDLATDICSFLHFRGWGKGEDPVFHLLIPECRKGPGSLLPAVSLLEFSHPPIKPHTGIQALPLHSGGARVVKSNLNIEDLYESGTMLGA